MTPFEWVLGILWMVSTALNLLGYGISLGKGKSTFLSDPRSDIITAIWGAVWGVLLLTIATPLTWFGVIVTIMVFFASLMGIMSFVDDTPRRKSIHWMLWRAVYGTALVVLLFTVGITV